MNNFNSETVNRLADKLSALDLGADERAALDSILDRAGDAGDVVAFGSFEKQPMAESAKAEQMQKVQAPELSHAGIKIADALGWRR